ncbi:hypothetical protein GIB67_001408 [Kingdonia uniflora]|uniref:Uncharacterized protein n=1 Tax=Kingdonia uniflora TaxID=39325 RepID=A0A7J7N7S8_9MAGN|nr:hypothetical protein GIB67_001408 [Kingdonia uniflora]
MFLMQLKKITLLFLVITASLFSTSFAGGRWRVVDKIDVEVTTRKSTRHQDEAESSVAHKRLLNDDYGVYDAAPTLVKPPFKLIPN